MIRSKQLFHRCLLKKEYSKGHPLHEYYTNVTCYYGVLGYSESIYRTVRVVYVIFLGKLGFKKLVLTMFSIITKYLYLTFLQFFWFGMLSTTLWLLGNLIHLMRSSDFSTFPQYNIRLNSHLRLDSWLMTVIAFSLVAFPTFIIQHLVSWLLLIFTMLYLPYNLCSNTRIIHVIIFMHN